MREKMKIAILTSNHQEVARIPVKLLDWVFCTLNNPHAEDLLKVTDSTGQVYWCDEIEFVDENDLKKHLED